MEKTDGFIEREENGMNIKETFFTRDENEEQENEINRENSSLLFKPKFIAFYPSMISEYNLTHIDCLIYGFIEFYLYNNPSKRFYFTNEQIAEIVGCSEDKASESICKLKAQKILETSYRMRANGGKIRFISRFKPVHDTVFNSVTTLPNGGKNYNKIKDNKEKDNKITCREIENPTSLFLKAWGETWKLTVGKGKVYPFNYPKEGAIIKSLLRIYSLEDMVPLAEKFFKSDDDFVRRTGYTIGVFKTQIPRLIADRKPMTKTERIVENARISQEKLELEAKNE